MKKIDIIIMTSKGIKILNCQKDEYDNFIDLLIHLITAKDSMRKRVVSFLPTYFKNKRLLNRILWLHFKYDEQDLFCTYTKDEYIKCKLEEHGGKIIIRVLPDDEYIDFMKMTLG